MARTKNVKLSADGASLISRVHWTEEEREKLFQHLVRQFEEKGVDPSIWNVTNRMVMIAQLNVIDEDRYRESLNPQDVERMQEMVNAYVLTQMDEGILAAHHAFVKEFNETPIDRVIALKLQLGTVEAERNELLLNIEQLKQNAVELSNQLAIALADLAKAKDAESKTAVVPETPPVSVLPLLICAPRIASEMKNKLFKKTDDVLFVLPKDSPADIKRKAIGRHCIGIEGQLSTDCARAAREGGMTFMSVRGGQTALENAVDEMILKNDQAWLATKGVKLISIK